MDRKKLSASEKLLAIVDAEFHPQTCNRKKLAVWSAFHGETGYRKSFRKIMSDIDTERCKASADLCREIIAQGGYDSLVAEEIMETVKGLFDGFCLNILIYPGEFTREDAKNRVRNYPATTFPQHFERTRKANSEGHP
jgi:hypothetical protein